MPPKHELSERSRRRHRRAIPSSLSENRLYIEYIDRTGGERLGEIGVPTLVLIGEEDLPDMHAISDRLAREIPGARQATIATTAHVPSMERPAEFDELVLGFLEEAA